jgi:4-hydroxy-2-oxoheptanedioate aldolase
MVIVRVPKGDEISLTTALDAGAAGIVIPHCESAEEVKKMIKEIRYRKCHCSLSIAKPWKLICSV